MRGLESMNRTRLGGFTLLEVLIAILIFSFGMLGLAALQTFSVKTNQSANFRSQATALAATMLDNVRANRSHVSDYYSNAYSSGAACDADAPAETPQAAQDLALWRWQVSCELPQGQAAIAPISDNEIAVCIRWSDSRLQEGAATGTSCTADATRFGAGSAAGGTGAGVDGDSSVFIVSSRL
jgi:type IV pilus assembly protein PilV